MSKLKSAVVKAPQRKPKRRRTKKLHKNLLDQLEFYFSEANLRHDPFMKEKTGEKGTDYVPLKLILSFPMIKELSTEKKHVISAIEESRIIELSEDNASIRRRLPVPRPPHNLDQSTLYIENLPPDTTIDWLKEVCQKIGGVRHVSIPRFRKSGRVKGFAFVEFSSPEEVSRACRILKDPPKNFFPNRTEKYLLRMKRQKMRENAHDHQDLETSPVAQFKTPEALQSGGSSCLNKSLDSALDIDIIGQETGTPSSSARRRKRRRSQRLSDQGTEKISPSDKDGKGSATHTPAKKLKSLPTRLSYDKSDLPSDNSAEPCREAEGSINVKKNKRKVLFSTGDGDVPTNSNFQSTVDIKKDKDDPEGDSRPNKRQKSSDSNLPKIHSDSKCDEKDLNGNISAKRNHDPGKSDTKSINNEVLDEQISQKNAENISSPLREANGVISVNPTQPTTSLTTAVENNQIKGAGDGPSPCTESKAKALKRKRSLSEPPFIPVNSAPKMQKIEDHFERDSQLRAVAEDPREGATGTFDVDQMIAQGRQQAEASIPKNYSNPELASRKFLQSVVAMPKATKRPRQKSRGAKQRKKAKTRQVPPKLNVMPKVEWVEYKREYKRLQMENMSRLKKTLRAGKNAGSVFIKKHLDVLKDGNVSDDSSSSSNSSDDASAKPCNEKESENKKLGKRGAPTFSAGVIASITAPSTSDENEKSALPSIEEIKSILNKYGRGVAYVDAKTGDGSGFVRFRDGDSAQRAIMEEKTLALCLLTGELEERYWDKLLASRAQKFAKERRKVRGRTKILLRAERCVEKAKRRHIRFDNDFAI